MGFEAVALLTIVPVEIEPRTYGSLAQAIDLSFLLAVLLCIPVMPCSLARGKLR